MRTHEGIFEFHGKDQTLEDEEESPLFKIYDEKLKKLADENVSLKERLKLKLQVSVNDPLENNQKLLPTISTKDLSNLYETLHSKHEAIKNEKKLLTLEKANLLRITEKLKQEKTCLEKEVTSLKISQSQLKRENEKANGELEKFSRALACHKQNATRSQKQLEKSRSQTEELLSLHCSECKHLKSSLDQAKIDLKEQRKEFNELETKLDNEVRETFLGKTKLVQANSSLRELISTADDVKLENKNLNEVVHELTKSNRESKTEAKRAELMMTELKAKIQSQKYALDQTASVTDFIQESVSNLLRKPQDQYSKACQASEKRLQSIVAANKKQIMKNNALFSEVLKAELKPDDFLGPQNSRVGGTLKVLNERLEILRLQNEKLSSNLHLSKRQIVVLEHEKRSLVTQKDEQTKLYEKMEAEVEKFKSNIAYLTEEKQKLANIRQNLAVEVCALQKRLATDIETSNQECFTLETKFKKIKRFAQKICLEKDLMEKKNAKLKILQRRDEKKCIDLERMLLEQIS